jgi:hypothetical protein
VSRTEYDELKARVDRLETLLHSRAQLPSSLAPQPGPESSSSQAQQHSSSTRLTATATAATVAPPGQQGNTARAPMLPYNSVSPPGPNQTQGAAAAAAFPAGLAGSSRPSIAPGSKDYGASAIALRSPNSPAGTGRTALPPLASLANGPRPFDGPVPPPNLSRLPPREHHQHREREFRELQHQPYAPLPPQPPPQQPLQQLHHQTKNCRAQTLTPLGERLRLSSFLQGPAAVPRLPCHRRRRSNCIRRLRLLTCGARGRCHWPSLSACHCPLLRFLVRQRSGVPSVRSENGSRSLALPIASVWGVTARSVW